MTAITDLEIFARVARTGNMSAAGREMKLSPAVVSKRISLLEERLGARLFQRTTRQLTLTETGEGFFKRVVDILNLVEEAEDFVSRRNTSPKGLLKVTAPTSFARLHVAPHLPAFSAAYPDIELDIHLSDHFVDIIRDGFDVAIRIGELKDSTMVARKLAANPQVLCATPSYLDAAGRPNSMDELESHNCLTVEGCDVWRLESAEETAQVRVGGSVRTNSMEFAREMLLAGHGIALCSVWDVGPDLESGRLERVLPDCSGSTGLTISAVYPCRDFMPAKVSAFIDFLADVYAKQTLYRPKMAKVA